MEGNNQNNNNSEFHRKASPSSIFEIIEKHQDFILKELKTTLAGYPLSAQDEVYNAVIKALEKAINEDRLRLEYGPASMKAYIRRVINSKCIDYFRRLKPKLRIISEREAAHWRKIESQMTDEEIRDAFISIGITLKDVDHPGLLIERLKGKTRKETAKEWGLSEGQVKGRLERTKKKLQVNPRIIRALEKELSKK